jgi:predicted nucleic acid-binding protein
VALIVLDASVVIAFLDRADSHHAAAVTAFAAHYVDNFVVLPASVYAEVLVGPYRRGPAALTTVEQFIADFAMRIEPLSPQIARRAAQLRSRHSVLKLPDAFVLATGDVLSASAVLTADSTWPKLSRRARVL